MQYYPQSIPMGPQFAPQGWVGDMISHQAPLIGSAVGGLTTELSGHASLGGLVGGATTMIARDYGHLLPFQAGPAMAAPAAYAPQGFWGNVISGAGNIAGQIVGGDTGRTISNVSGFAQYLPFQAGPGVAPQVVAAPQAYAPQGFWGNMFADVAPVIGQHVGGNAGRVISTVGGLADMLPFQAGPTIVPQQAYAPQGFWGNVISGVGNIAGGVIGGNAGRAVQDVSSIARFLPFQAGPNMAQLQPAYAPQGIFGSIGGGLLGGVIGNALGNKGLGSAIGGIVGGFLPFQAGPGQPVQYIPVNNDQVVYH